MPYYGNNPATNFESTPVVQRFNGDGSDTTFTLTTDSFFSSRCACFCRWSGSR
jgi:hypothetical protein